MYYIYVYMLCKNTINNKIKFSWQQQQIKSDWHPQIRSPNRQKTLAHFARTQSHLQQWIGAASISSCLDYRSPHWGLHRWQTNPHVCQSLLVGIPMLQRAGTNTALLYLLAPTGALVVMMVYYIYIYLSGHFFRFSLSLLMQLMLQVSL